MQAGSEVKNIRHALMPVGLAKNIRKRLIILYGRNSIRSIIQRIKNVECLSWLIQISSLQGELVLMGFREQAVQH